MDIVDHSPPTHHQTNKQKNTPPRVGLDVKNGDNSNKNPISIRKNKHSHNNDTSSSSSSSDEEEGATSFKKTIVIQDDVMTEDDTDIEEEQDKLFMGLTNEAGDVPNLLKDSNSNENKKNDSNNYEYNAYSTSPHDNIYHPTASIFEDNNNNKDSNNNNQPGLFNDGENLGTSFLSPRFSTVEESFLQDNNPGFYERTAFNRRPSQLQYEMNTTLNALCPPSHVLKARRLSKNTIKTSSSTPITPVRSLSTTSVSSAMKERRKPSIVDNYSKEFSNGNNSAVSPRFMALRKLSEVTTLPSHSISYSSVPPVPQIPSTYHNTADENNTTTNITSTEAVAATSNKSDNTVAASNDHENRVLARIDDIIETQLQFHLGQVVWRASESHLEARRFWEEQKKEMFVFASTLVDRMESQVDMTRRMTLGSLTSTPTPETNDEDTHNVDLLKKELNMYKSKSQRQLFELEMLKTRNSELEKQHEIDTISIAKQWEDKDSTLKRLNQLEQQERKNQLGRSTNMKQKDLITKLFNLETENKQLKTQIKQSQVVNRQLLEDAATFETSLKSRDKEIKHVKHKLSEAELHITNMSNKRKMVATESTTTTATRGEGLDCSEDFGKKASTTSHKTSSSKKSENWADIMESEDEAKKSAEEWAKKYRELQTNYFDVCLQLEKLKKEGVSSEDEKKIYDLGQSIIVKDEEIRHLKQVENVNRIQMNYMQLELNKYQKLQLPPAAENEENAKQKAYRSKCKSQQRKSTPASMTTPITNTNTTTTTTTTITTATNANNSDKKTPSRTPTPTPPPPSVEPDYITEDGFLTFTTEINGKLSKYSIKLPNGYEQATTKSKKRNTPVHEPMTKKNKLNPNAVTWKS